MDSNKIDILCNKAQELGKQQTFLMIIETLTEELSKAESREELNTIHSIYNAVNKKYEKLDTVEV